MNIIYLITFSITITINSNKQGVVYNMDNSDIKVDNKLKDKVQTIVNKDKSKPYTEYKLNSLKEAKTNFDTPITNISPITVDINIHMPEKTLYKGFEEKLSKLRKTDYKTKDSRTNDSVTDVSTKGSL